MSEKIIVLLEEIRDAQNEQLKRQEKGANLLSSAGKLFKIIVPILIILIAYISWLLFR
jgi:CHASE3 domain sensor protein